MSAQTIDPTKLVCVNESCAKPLEPDTRFCPYCRTEQSLAVADGVSAAAAPRAARVTTTSPPGAEEVLVLRPSDKVWDFPEGEDPVPAGQRRPLMVLDEQTVHLSHTDRVLTADELLLRVQAIIAADQVPIQAEHLPARWQSDPAETRPRIIASLKDHDYSDFKMILGVDYMGRWASIKMYLAVEPPIIPPIPPPAKVEPYSPAIPAMVIVASIILCLGAMTLSGGGSSTYPVIGLSIVLLIGGIFGLVSGKSDHDSKVQAIAAAHRDAQKRQALEIEQGSQIKKLLRTFKIDDMRLFCSAMESVFKMVVDDIVQKEGAQIERIEGGSGNYLKTDGLTRLVEAPRESDAGQDLGM